MKLDVSIASIAVFAIGLALLGVYLARVRVYSDEELDAARHKPVVSFLIDLSYKRRIFEVALDVALIVLAQYGAYALVFGPASNSPDWQLFLKTVPLVIFIKLAAFVMVGVYRGLWRYAGLADVMVFTKAVVLSSVFTVVLFVAAFRFEGFSRTVIAVDAVLLVIGLTTTRFAFRVLRKMLPAPHARTAKRVLIYGAGDGGELLYRELLNNSDLQYVPVAFVDDDTHKAGRLLHGLRVHSGAKPLGQLCRDLNVQEIFLSTMKLPGSRLREIVAECETLGVPVKRMKIDIQRLADTEIGWVLPAADSAAPVSLVTPAHGPRLTIEPRKPISDKLSTQEH